MTGLLLHLNGAPGVGKSTLARRWANDRPGTLCCDIDLLRTMLGGWRQDFAAAGATIRPLAIAMISTQLSSGRDVVLPQLIANGPELDRFGQAATVAGGRMVRVLVSASEQTLAERWRTRGSRDAWTQQAVDIVAEGGGGELVAQYAEKLRVVAQQRGHLVLDADGDPEATYAQLVDLVSAAQDG